MVVKDGVITLIFQTNHVFLSAVNHLKWAISTKKFFRMCQTFFQVWLLLSKAGAALGFGRLKWKCLPQGRPFLRDKWGKADLVGSWFVAFKDIQHCDDDHRSWDKKSFVRVQQQVGVLSSEGWLEGSPIYSVRKTLSRGLIPGTSNRKCLIFHTL